VLRLKAGRVDENELGVGARQNAEQAMSRRLRLARGDTEFLADQRVEQGRLAHIGAPDDGNRATAKYFFHCPRVLSIRIAVKRSIPRPMCRVRGALLPARRDACWC